MTGPTIPTGRFVGFVVQQRIQVVPEYVVMTQNAPTAPQPQTAGNLFANLAFNIVLPVLILSKFSTEEYLGPVWGLVIALAFPVGFGLWELKKSGKLNFFSVVGIISVLLTGGMSLLQLDPKYIAIKEAAVPGLIGLLILFSGRTRFPLIKTILENMQLLNLVLLSEKLSARGTAQQFEKALDHATHIIAGSFFLSSVMNYLLAKWLLVSPPGTAAYNEELAKMTALSYPVIAIPSTLIMMGAIWYIFSRIPKLTGQPLESFFHEQ